MSDAPLAESRAFNLHSAGTDLVEGSALAIKSASGAITVDGVAETTINVLGVGGGTAHDAVDSGNPVKVGGHAYSGVPTNVANNDRVDAWFGQKGQLVVQLFDANTGNVAVPNFLSIPSDTQTGSLNGLVSFTFPYLYNGSSWDRTRSEVGTTGFIGVGGSVAHDAVDAGSPVKIGGYASTNAPTAISAAGDRVNAWFDSFGRMVTGEVDPETNIVAGLTNLRDRLIAQRYTVLADSIADGLAGFWTTTTANGGTAAVTAGEGLIQTSANASGSSQISSTPVYYYPGQVSWFNSAIRVGDTGSAGNIRRWGVFTVSGTTPQDGYYYELSGTTLNAVSVSGGTPTAVASTSWTRFSTAPFTLDTSYHQFEIRWTANAVQFYIDNILRHVASGGASPITQTLNFPMTMHSVNSSGATNRVLGLRNVGVGRFGTAQTESTATESLSTAPNDTSGLLRGVLATGVGPGYDRKTNPTGIAATSTSNAVTVVTDGADVISFHVTTIGTTPGSMIFETTNDDSNWVTAGFVIKYSTGPDTRIEGSFVPAVNDVYMVRTTGARQVRYRVNAVYASGTATVKVTSSLGIGLIKAIDMAPPPHNIGYALQSVTAQYTTNQTSTTLGPTISSSQRMVVTSIQIQAGGTTSGTCQVYFGTGAYSRGTNKAIFDGEFAPSSTSKPGYAQSPPVPYMGAADEEMKVTTAGTGLNPLTVTVWFYIVSA